MRFTLLLSLLLFVSKHSFSQDTIICCTRTDTYVASQCDLILKDSVCYYKRKEFSGTLIVNCTGDWKSTRDNGVYTYVNGIEQNRKKLKRNQTLQSEVSLSIDRSSSRSFSGGMRREFGGDHNETYDFQITANREVRIDSIIHLNKVFVPADSVALVNGKLKFQVRNSFSGTTGKYNTVALMDSEDQRMYLSEYFTRGYQVEALKICYSVNGVQQFAVKKDYDSAEHSAAP
jgi:hypothetical protein